MFKQYYTGSVHFFMLLSTNTNNVIYLWQHIAFESDRTVYTLKH